MRCRTLLVAVAAIALSPALRAQQDISNTNQDITNTYSEHGRAKKSSVAPDGTIYVQDNELRSAKYNSIYASPPPRNGFVNPGIGTVEARFCYSFHRYFYYCTSEYSRQRCDVPFMDIHSITHNKSDACTYPYMLCEAHTFADMQLLPDNTTRHSNSARFFSFDGYVVYDADTLYGIVTITKYEVGIEHQSVTNGMRSSSYELTDKHLKAITVFKGLRQLNLVRVHPFDKHLSRVVHAGKLMMYDRNFSFLTANNISSSLHIVPSTTGEPVRTKSTEALIALVNSTYNLNIVTAEWTEDKLFTVINRLD